MGDSLREMLKTALGFCFHCGGGLIDDAVAPYCEDDSHCGREGEEPPSLLDHLCTALRSEVEVLEDMPRAPGQVTTPGTVMATAAFMRIDPKFYGDPGRGNERVTIIAQLARDIDRAFYAYLKRSALPPEVRAALWQIKRLSFVVEPTLKNVLRDIHEIHDTVTAVLDKEQPSE